MGKLLSSTATLLLALLVILSPVASAAPATPEASSLHVEATVTPHTFSVSATATVRDVEVNGIDSFTAHLSYKYSNKTCTEGLRGSIEARGPALEPLDLNSVVDLDYTVNINSGVLVTDSNHTARIVLTYDTANTSVELRVNSAGESHGRVNVTSGDGTTSRSGYIYLLLNYESNTSGEVPSGPLHIEENLTYEISSVKKGNITILKVKAKGPIALEVPQDGGSFSLSFTLSTLTNANLTAIEPNVTHIDLHSVTNMTFTDYVRAMAIATLLSTLVTQLNLSQYVKVVEPQSFTNPTVTVIVDYEGNISLAELEEIGTAPELPPGTSAPPGASTVNLSKGIEELVKYLAGIAPYVLPSIDLEEINGTDHGIVHAVADASNGILKATLSANASATGNLCKQNYTVKSLEATAVYTGSAKKLELTLEATLRTEEPFTPALLSARVLHDFLAGTKAPEDLRIIFKSSGGVTLSAGNTGDVEKILFTKSNYTALEDLTVSYSGEKVRGVGGLLHVSSERVKLPPVAGGAYIKEKMHAVVELPFHGPIHRNLTFVFFNSVAPDARIIVHPGAWVNKSVYLAVIPKDEVKLPSSVEAHKAGPALKIEGVKGMVTVHIPYKAEYPGKPALLVIHDNGTTEIVENVVVKNGFLLANVTANSVFAPIVLGGGGGGGTTTTSTATTTTKTVTPPMTTTAQTTTTQTTTTTSPTTTVTTTSPVETTTTAQTTTTPHTATTTEQTTTGTTTTTTGGTSPTATSPATTLTTTTTGGGVSASKVAAIVIVIIVIAVAAALLLRR